MDNLVSLCRKCHANEHAGDHFERTYPTRPDYEQLKEFVEELI